MTHSIFGFETVQWARHSFSAKSVECSIRGNPRYSAMTARLSDGRTIEQHYQCDVKGFEPGGYKWRKGKGKPPVNGKGRTQLLAEYIVLWARYADENPGYIEELSDGMEQAGITVLTNCFANTEINQAHALSVLVNSYRQKKAMPELQRGCKGIPSFPVPHVGDVPGSMPIVSSLSDFASQVDMGEPPADYQAGHLDTIEITVPDAAAPDFEADKLDLLISM